MWKFKKDFIKVLRDQRNMSMRQIAQFTGVSYDNIRRIEKGQMPKQGDLTKICNTLGINPGWFWEKV